MNIEKGVLKSFNGTDFTATVGLTGSYKAYLENISVARNIAPGEMTEGRKVAVLFFDEHNTKEAVVFAIYD